MNIDQAIYDLQERMNNKDKEVRDLKVEFKRYRDKVDNEISDLIRQLQEQIALNNELDRTVTDHSEKVDEIDGTLDKHYERLEEVNKKLEEHEDKIDTASKKRR